MDKRLKDALRRRGGILRRGDVVDWLVDNAVRSGRLTRVHPSTYIDSDLPAGWVN